MSLLKVLKEWINLVFSGLIRFISDYFKIAVDFICPFFVDSPVFLFVSIHSFHYERYFILIPPLLSFIIPVIR